MSELEKILIEDNIALKKAGGKLAEAAQRVIRTYDGIHRLSKALSKWNKVVADEGGRNNRPELHTEPPEDENQCVLNWILDYPDRKWGGFWLAEKYSYAKAVYEDRYSGWLPLPPEPEGRE